MLPFRMTVEQDLVLQLLNGAPITGISRASLPKIRQISTDLSLQLTLEQLKPPNNNYDEVRTRVYFAVLLAKLDVLDSADLNEVLEWATTSLEFHWTTDDMMLKWKCWTEGIVCIITICLQQLHDVLNYDLMWKLTWFSDASLPWSFSSLADESTKALRLLSISTPTLTELTHSDFKLIQPANSKISKAGYARSQWLKSALMPKLGYMTVDPRDEWKKEGIRSVGTLSYLLRVLEEQKDTAADTHKQVRDLWWLLSPSILNILDDHDATVKIMGMRLLHQLLNVVEPEYLQQTQLAQVYRDSAMVLLTYLPPSTPTKQSVEILSVTYPTLIQLAELTQIVSQRRKELLALLNSGIFVIWNSVNDNFQIQTIIIEQTTIIIDSLGVYTTMALPRLTYHLGFILSNPFLHTHTPLAKTALRCLSAMLIQCWPRIGERKYDISAMLAICWRNCENNEIRKEVKRCWLILCSIVEKDGEQNEFVAEIAGLDGVGFVE